MAYCRPFVVLIDHWLTPRSDVVWHYCRANHVAQSCSHPFVLNIHWFIVCFVLLYLCIYHSYVFIPVTSTWLHVRSSWILDASNFCYFLDRWPLMYLYLLSWVDVSWYGSYEMYVWCVCMMMTYVSRLWPIIMMIMTVSWDACDILLGWLWHVIVIITTT